MKNKQRKLTQADYIKAFVSSCRRIEKLTERIGDECKTKFQAWKNVQKSCSHYNPDCDPTGKTNIILRCCSHNKEVATVCGCNCCPLLSEV